MGKKTFHTPAEINTGFFPLFKGVVEPEVEDVRKPSLTSEVGLHEEIKRQRAVAAFYQLQASAEGAQPTQANHKEPEPRSSVSKQGFPPEIWIQEKRQRKPPKHSLSVITLCPSPWPRPLRSKARRDAIL